MTGLQRCGKSCRLRWTNYLRPDIKRGRFSFEEEEAIIQLHSVLGNKYVFDLFFYRGQILLDRIIILLIEKIEPIIFHFSFLF